jgi:hypothetical protein
MKLDIHIVFMLTHALNIHVLPVKIAAPSVPITVHYKDQNVFHPGWTCRPAALQIPKTEIKKKTVF